MLWLSLCRRDHPLEVPQQRLECPSLSVALRRARQYRESFEVYGSKKGVEWPLIEGEPLVVHTAKKPEPEIPEKWNA